MQRSSVPIGSQQDHILFGDSALCLAPEEMLDEYSGVETFEEFQNLVLTD